MVHVMDDLLLLRENTTKRDYFWSPTGASKSDTNIARMVRNTFPHGEERSPLCSIEWAKRVSRKRSRPLLPLLGSGGDIVRGPY